MSFSYVREKFKEEKDIGTTNTQSGSVFKLDIIYFIF